MNLTKLQEIVDRGAWLWSLNESDTTERLNSNNVKPLKILFSKFSLIARHFPKSYRFVIFVKCYRRFSILFFGIGKGKCHLSILQI